MVRFFYMNERNEKEITTGEIMEYLQGDLMGFLQEHMVTKEEFHGLETRVDGIETKVDKLDERVGSLEVKVNQVKLDLLDAMDEKLCSQRRLSHYDA